MLAEPIQPDSMRPEPECPCSDSIIINNYSNNNNNKVTPLTANGTTPNNTVIAVKARNIFYTRSKSGVKTAILNDLSLTVPSGSVYGLIGPSGCGKTTFLRCVIGYKKPDSGRIRVFGCLPGQSGLGIPGPNIGYMPQDIALNCDLTIEEMLVYFGHIYGIPDRELAIRIKDLIKLLDLQSGDRLIGNLSGGQQRRVSFACTVIHRPKLLILDEPTVGCDPLVREKMWNFIFKLCSQFGSTVIITTHYIEETRRANLVGFMRKGKILEEDEPTLIAAKFGVSSLEETFAHLCREEKLRKQFSVRSAETDYRPSKLLSESESKCPDWTVRMFSDGEYWRIQNAVMNRIFLRFYKMKPAFYGSGLILFFIITIYGFFYGRTPFDLKIGLVNHESPTNFSRHFIDSIDTRRLQPLVFDEYNQALQATVRGDIHGFLYIGRNFTRHLRTKIIPLDIAGKDVGDPTEGNIIYRGDFTNVILLITIFRSLLESYRNFTLGVTSELGLNPRLTDLPIEVGEVLFGGLDRNDYFGVTHFVLPVFTVYLVFVHTVNFSLFSLMREKLDLMFERNYAAGVTTSQLLIGHFIVYFVTTGLHVITLFLFLLYILKVPCNGSLALACGVLLLQVATGITTTFLCALFSSGIGMMFIFTTGFMLACMFVGGVLWPYEALPYYMRSFRYVTPFSTSTEAFIAIMIKGLPLAHPSVYINLIAPFIYFIVTSVVSFSCFSY